MAVTRRDLLKGAGALAALQIGSPFFFRGVANAEVDPGTRQRLRLVLIDLGGGNDGLNTVTPYAGQRRIAYDIARMSINLPTSQLAPLDRPGDAGEQLGLNNHLGTVYGLYQQDRVAIVQGVDYPDHSYSHFTSDDIWQSGDLEAPRHSGWLGRHLDRTGLTAGEMRAVAIGSNLPLALNGDVEQGYGVGSLPLTFVDGTGAIAVHDAYGRYSLHPASEPLRQFYGGICAGTNELASTAGTIAQPTTNNALVNALLGARTLLSGNYGVEIVMVSTGGYDTHTGQTAQHALKLDELDDAIEAFFLGTRDGVAITAGGQPIGPLAPDIEAKTLVMTFSEFGRRIGDNGDGTDHGASAPLFLIGPPQTGLYAPAPGSGLPKLVPGLHGDHPPLSSPTHTQALVDNLQMTTDNRSVYQAVLSYWLNQASDGSRADGGDPAFQISGSTLEANGSLAGLFTRALPGPAPMINGGFLRDRGGETHH